MDIEPSFHRVGVWITERALPIQEFTVERIFEECKRLVKIRDGKPNVVDVGSRQGMLVAHTRVITTEPYATFEAERSRRLMH